MAARRTRGTVSEIGAFKGETFVVSDPCAAQVLNKTDLVSPAQLQGIRAFVSKLNPAADIVESERGRVSPETVLGTGQFDLATAASHPEWLVEARVGEHTPESIEYGISGFTFKARTPFHPLRLRLFLDRVLQPRASLLLDGTSDSTSSSPPGGGDDPLAAVVRAKGTLYVATPGGRERQATLAVAGRIASLTPGSTWWASVAGSHKGTLMVLPKCSESLSESSHMTREKHPP